MDIGGTINYNAYRQLQRVPDDLASARQERPDRGCSSGVEHNLAKLGVEGLNSFARSNFPNQRWTAEDGGFSGYLCGSLAVLSKQF
jgi:hypothetical protein